MLAVQNRIIQGIYGLPINILNDIIEFIEFKKLKYQNKLSMESIKTANDKENLDIDLLSITQLDHDLFLAINKFIYFKKRYSCRTMLKFQNRKPLHSCRTKLTN